MSTPTTVSELMKGDELQRAELRRLIGMLPLEQAFDVCHEALKLLSPAERTSLYFRNLDLKFAGILDVAELRMPIGPSFGPFAMPRGDLLTDYDRARTFILKKRRPGAWIKGFYPEFARSAPRDRVIGLAGAHVGCAPGGQKQANLFSLCGKYDFNTAKAKTQPNGTTCALFMRAVLRACDDARMTDDKLPEQANLIFAMGMRTKFADVAPESRFCWIDARSNYDLHTNQLPMRGDLFYVILPGVVYDHYSGPKEDSGHVGFVAGNGKIVRGKDDNLHFDSIDGGISQGADRGHWTVAQDQQFQKNPFGHWQLYNKRAIGGQSRILIGFVDLDKVLGSFAISPDQIAAGRTRYLGANL